MKYTLPRTYSNAGAQVVIPDAWLTSAKSANGGSLKGAIDQWLYENGYMNKEEYSANIKVVAERQVEKEKTARKRKPDETKQALIAGLYAYLTQLNDVEGVEVTNAERLISFTIGEDRYDLTLAKKRKAK